jgi:(1->4)-alpha-D-glucan 1-alpha-D-glucosylmutase
MVVADGGRVRRAAAGEPAGTIDQHPNWRRKLPVPVEEWPRDARLRRLARELGAERGRASSKRAGAAAASTTRRSRAPPIACSCTARFTFRDATKLVPYLAKLGVSHIYCSPYLKARPAASTATTSSTTTS